jgi:hypothetical protein
MKPAPFAYHRPESVAGRRAGDDRHAAAETKVVDVVRHIVLGR